MFKSSCLAAGLVLAGTLGAQAVDYRSTLQTYLENSVLPWANDAVIMSAIAEQNAETGSFDATTIDALDLKWREEVGSSDTPTIDDVLMTPASDFLRAQVDASAGAITEIFVMDAVGLNVASSGVTSDYWQGDEAKHQETYGAGPGAIHISEVEFDESSQTYQAQISISLSDPDSGEPVGAMTIGVNAEMLM